jgi:hypothetical protein
MAFGALCPYDLRTASLRRQVLRTGGLDPIAARLIDHVGYSARHLEIAELWVIAVCRHVTYAFDCMLRQCGESLRGAAAPGFRVADLWRIGDARRMALGTGCIDHVFATSLVPLCARQRKRHDKRQ